ncbi:glutathione S-transferase theta-1-like [Gigantopelta aegis]|uniref:glutathione S-transferase theta-1-like n=1 Tax=Gigantopelta aegis TaxID=1735272 RepID=UPI001B88C570|nr:glutathione S-transferase theta-1-like [Gigantopelta aegis]
MALKFYFDLMSQPSRAVYMFLKLNSIPFEAKPVALRKGEHHAEDFAKINPFKLVPVIDDNGFVLTESVAIMKYLAVKYNVADHWYPRSDLQLQARVDEYMNWQHFNTRLNAAMLFQNLFIIPQATGKPISWGKVENFRKGCSKVIHDLEKYYLKSQPFLCGADISMADLLGVCEWMQLYGVHEDRLFMASPLVSAWMDRVKSKTQPVFDEAHKFTYRVREVYKPQTEPPEAKL